MRREILQYGTMIFVQTRRTIYNTTKVIKALTQQTTKKTKTPKQTSKISVSFFTKKDKDKYKRKANTLKSKHYLRKAANLRHDSRTKARISDKSNKRKRGGGISKESKEIEAKALVHFHFQASFAGFGRICRGKRISRRGILEL